MTDKDTEYLELCDQLRFRPVGTTAAQMRDAADAIESLQARQHQSDLNYDALEKQNTALQADVARLKADNANLRAMNEDCVRADEGSLCQLRAENAEQGKHAEAMATGIEATADHHCGKKRAMSKCPMCRSLDAYRAWKELK